MGATHTQTEERRNDAREQPRPQPRAGGDAWSAQEKPTWTLPPGPTHLRGSHVLKRTQGLHPGLHGARLVTLPTSGWEEQRQERGGEDIAVARLALTPFLPLNVTFYSPVCKRFQM